MAPRWPAVLVDKLVREAVLAPGSRSAPPFALADAGGRLRLHVRIDERSAALLALGLAKAPGTPVPVLTTSGTATANLDPAVLEASYAGVPWLLLTADRPPELRARGQAGRRPGHAVRRRRPAVHQRWGARAASRDRRPLVGHAQAGSSRARR